MKEPAAAPTFQEQARSVVDLVNRFTDERTETARDKLYDAGYTLACMLDDARPSGVHTDAQHAENVVKLSRAAFDCITPGEPLRHREHQARELRFAAEDFIAAPTSAGAETLARQSDDLQHAIMRDHKARLARDPTAPPPPEHVAVYGAFLVVYDALEESGLEPPTHLKHRYERLMTEVLLDVEVFCQAKKTRDSARTLADRAEQLAAASETYKRRGDMTSTEASRSARALSLAWQAVRGFDRTLAADLHARVSQAHGRRRTTRRRGDA